MAAYEAIRDSFREFNRTLIDSQAWNAQHEVSMADRQLKQTMLLNQLNQQQVNNRLAQERIGIARDGNAIAVQRNASLDNQFKQNHEETVNYHRNVFKQQEAELTEKINNNRTTHEDRVAANAGLAALREQQLQKETQATEQLKNINEKAENDLNIMREGNKLSPVIIDPKELSNSIVKDKVKDYLFINHSASLNEDTGEAIGKDGQPLQMKKYQQAQYKHLIRAEQAANLDRRNATINELNIIKQTKSKLDNQVANRKSIYTKHESAMMKRQSHLLDAAIEDKTNFLNKLDTPQGQAAELRFQATQIESAADKLSNPIYGDKPYEAANYITKANDLRKQATAIEAAEKDRLVALVKANAAGTSAAKGVLSEKDMLNVTPLYEVDTPAGVMVMDAVKPKVGTVSNVINVRYQKGGRKEESRLNIREDTIAKVEKYEQVYHEEMKEINDLTTQEIDSELQKYNIVPEKNNHYSKIKALEGDIYRTFRDRVHTLAGDNSIMVYKPNATTNKLKYLGQ